MTEDPDSADIYVTPGEEAYEKGWEAYSSDHYAEAVQLFRQAANEAPDQPDYAYALGIALEANQQNEEAIHAFEQAIHLLLTLEDKVRAGMLQKMAAGHILKIKTGQWGGATNTQEAA